MCPSITSPWGAEFSLIQARVHLRKKRRHCQRPAWVGTDRKACGTTQSRRSFTQALTTPLGFKSSNPPDAWKAVVEFRLRPARRVSALPTDRSHRELHLALV